LPAPHDMTEHSCRQAGRLTTRAGPCWRDRRQVLLNDGQILADPGLQRRFNPPREFLERQPTRQKMLAKRDHCLLTFGI
jgi:hypothetical protein